MRLPDEGDFVWWLVGMAAATIYVVAQMLNKLVGYIAGRLGGNGEENGNGEERREGYADLRREIRAIAKNVEQLPERTRVNRVNIEKVTRRVDRTEERVQHIERTMATREDLRVLATKDDVKRLEKAFDNLADRLDRHFQDSDRWRRGTPPDGNSR